MRRLVAIAPAAVAALALAACGVSRPAGQSRPATVSGGIFTALSYFPGDTPLVATVATDPHGTSGEQAQALQAGEPDAAIAKAALFSELAKAGVDYNRDVKPLFGNPIAVGIGGTAVSGTSTPFLAVWPTHSQAALAHLVSDLGVTTTGSHDGATLYRYKGFAFAVDGSLLVVSRSTADVTAALDRHASSTGFTAAEYAAEMRGLPSDAVVSVAGDLRPLLDTPKAARARAIPWVGAITGYGLTFTASAKRMAVQFRLDTSGRSLSADQLPIASGSATPALAVGSGTPIALGLRDPAQLWRFITDSERVADPAGYRRLRAGERTAQQRTTVDIDRLLGSLTGDVQVSSTGHVTVGRIAATAADAAEWEQVLGDPGSGTTSTALGGGFYRLVEKDGTTLVGGAVGDELLLGQATAAQERTFAGAASTPGHGTGAVAFQVAMGQLVKLAMSRRGTGTSPLATQLTSMLGPLVGSIQATPQALTGGATLQLK